MIDELMGALGSEGWGKFENLEKKVEQQQQDMRANLAAQAKDLAEVFSTPAGKRVLEILASQIIFAPHMLPLGAAHTAEQQALFAAFRQGQKDIVASIVNAIIAARGDDPKKPKKRIQKGGD